MMGATKVKIILSGGPAELAASDNSISAAELGQPLKISYRAGYEHFVHDGEYRTVDGCEVAVFRWTYRTQFAE